MTDLRNQRRMAAAVLKCGLTRVWIDPLRVEDVGSAVTRADVQKLVKRGYVRAIQKKGVSRGRARALAVQKRSGRRRGEGSRRGGQGSKARQPRKRGWIQTIRPLRRVLRELRVAGHITPHDYRLQYRKAKGGLYRSKAHLLAHLKTAGVLKQPQAGTQKQQGGG